MALSAGPVSIMRLTATAALAGGIAMGCAGALDAILALSRATQFVQGGQAFAFVIFSTLVHTLSGFLFAGIAASATVALYRKTAFGPLAAHVLREHELRRCSSPEAALRITATIFSAAPAVLVSLLAVHTLLMPFVSGRQVVRLIVLVTMAGTIAGILLAVPLTFALSRLVEVAARPALRYERTRRALTWIWSPLALTGGFVLCVFIAWLVAHWSSLEVRALRGALFVMAAAIAAFVPAWYFARYVLAWTYARPVWLRRALAVLTPALLLAAIVTVGHNPAVIKSTTAHTELGGRLTRAIRRVFDWDRDGYARLLGGGDCDDGDPLIHPGAVDTPGDHVDQNCLGGDAVINPPEHPSFMDRAAAASDLNILLITIDTLRADHLSFAGYARNTSPNIDKLAAHSVVFENGWSNAASTYHAMPALLTGRMPLDIHTGPMLDGSPTIASNATTLGEALGELGYLTGAITNLPYFEPARGLSQGFEVYDNENASLHSRAGKGDARGSSAPQQTAKALRFIDQHRDRKWFLWLHYFDPHYRYEAHPDVADWGSRDIDLYDAEIRFTDAAMGDLLSGLVERGMAERTIIVLTSDHGESFGEHGMSFHGNHLYSVQTRVPFLLSVPGVPPRRASTPIGHTDLYATIVNLAGGQPSPNMMGRSMVDVLLGREVDHVVYQELSAKSARNMRGAASSTCHVIYSTAPDTVWEVYRVDRDPMETIDLASTDECMAVRLALAKRYSYR